jgi:ATP-dependent Clp protease ATP-binding subunit ClpC
MKYISLPIHLFRFWYFESFGFFVRSFKNLILYLEEDLAVGLMWKLLFVPLYHDSSIVGRILSLIFRLIRIFIGLVAFALISAVVLIAAIYWYALPILLFFNFFAGFRLITLLIIFFGVGLFVVHKFTHPHKKVWQVHDSKLIWSSSKLKKQQVNISFLLKHFEVINLIKSLELDPSVFVHLSIPNPEGLASIAFELAKKTESAYIGPNHFFIASLQTLPNIEEFLLPFQLSVEDLKNALFYQEQKKNKWRLVYFWEDDFAVHHLKGVNRGWLSIPTPYLDQFAEDLTKTAAQFGYDDFIGRKNTVSEVITILSQDQNRNVCLVGSPGTGKSTLVRYLAKLIIQGDAPSSITSKRLVALDTTRLLSGIRSEGELADRITILFREVQSAGNLMVTIEEFHTLGVGEAGSFYNLYSLLLPYIDSSTFQFIATTEPENYTKIIETNGAFARLFTKIELSPASIEETVLILEDRAIELERYKKIRITYRAIKKITELVPELIHDRVLPDSALAILAEALPSTRSGVIDSEIIEQVLSNRVNVPLASLKADDKDKLLNLEQLIHHRMIDQEEAVKKVADTLRRASTGLREKTKPIGSFLFVGPTGVGKTELAKTLAEIYFSKGTNNFFRYDMSEYQNPESVSRLIGMSGQGGDLTEAVRNKQYCLILLDEFEKAHQNILTLFLQVLDDGRLTDGAGRTVDFTNTIVIATSNSASLTIANGLKEGQTIDDLTPVVRQELLQQFKPELINRFDEIVLFKPLSEIDLQKLVVLKLQKVKDQLKDEGYQIEFDQSLVAALAQKGFDPVLGARPLQRVIQDSLESNLSKMILENKLTKGKEIKIGVEILN